MEEVGSVGKIALGTYIGQSAIKATEAIGNLAKSAVEVGSNFETAMSQVAATMGITTDEIAAGSADFEMLSAKAKEMGAATKFTASEAAEGLNILAMAGLSAKEATEGIDTVLNLAAAGTMSLDEAATYVTASVKAFSDEMSNASYYADLMAKGATLANTDVKGLGAALSGVGATAASYGQTAEGLTLSLLRLAEQNVTGAEAATAMNRAMMDLYTPTDGAKQKLDELGVSAYNFDGSAREFNEVIDDLNAALSGMSAEESNAAKNAIFTTFGLQAFNKMTVASTEKVQSFKEGLAEASGSAMQQMETQTENLQGKITIFGSACEAVGVSVYEVFEDMMKDGVDDATDAMTRLNKSITSGSLGSSLKKLSTSIGNFADKAIDAGEEALPVLIDGLAWILENGDLIIAGIVGMETATFTMNSVVPVIQAVTASWTAYKTANEGATISQWLLNTAMSANPAGILLTALVGLTAALGAYSFMVDDVTAAQSEETQAIEKEIQASQELNDQLRKNQEERQNTSKEYEAQEKTVRNYLDELKELTGVEKKTTDQKAKIQAIVDKLNTSVEGLNLAYDVEKDVLNMTNEELEKKCDLLLQEAKISAAREDLTRIAKDQYEAEKLLAQQEADLETHLKEINRLQLEAAEDAKQHVDAAGNIVETYTAVDAELDNAKTKLGELQTEHNNTKQTIADLGAEYQQTLSYIGEGETTLQEAGAVEEGFANTTEGMGDAADTASEAYSEMYDSIYETVEKAINIFDAWDASTSASKATLQSNLDSQVAGLKAWGDNLESLATRTDVAVNQEFLAYLAEMGPSAAGEIATLASMTAEELQKYQESFVTAMTLPSEVTDQIMQSYEVAGTAALEGAANGMTDETGQAAIKTASENVSKAATDAINESLGTDEGGTPSSKTAEAGKALDEGIAQGVEDGQPALNSDIEGACADITSAFEKNLSKDKFTPIGQYIAAGLAEGIRAGKSNAINEAVAAATEMYEAAKGALDIHSPSRKFEYLGEMCVAGWVKGMEGMTNENAFTNTVNASLRTVQADLSGGMNATVGASGGFTQINNFNQQMQSPDEIAQALRIEQRYGLMGGKY